MISWQVGRRSDVGPNKAVDHTVARDGSARAGASADEGVAIVRDNASLGSLEEGDRKGGRSGNGNGPASELSRAVRGDAYVLLGAPTDFVVAIHHDDGVESHRNVNGVAASSGTEVDVV